MSVMQLQNRHTHLKPPFLMDLILLGGALALACFSLVMIYSATGVVSLEKYSDPLFFVKRQSLAVVIGLTLLIVVSNLNINWLRKVSPWCLVACLFFLALTFIPGLGRSSGGAQRWLSLPIVNFQPAELVKILFVVFMAGYFTRRQENLGRFSYAVFLPMLFVTIVAAVLLMQPDFGSAAIIALVTLAMILAAGVKLRHLMYSFLPLGIAVTVLIASSPYRMKRVLAFLSPDQDLLGRGYQLTQSLISVSSGGVSGVGLGDSMQKLYFLPAAHTDFIFALVAEELGFIGAAILMSAFLVVLWRGFKIAKSLIPDMFSYILAVGLTMLIVVPAFLNIGVVTGMLPTKGLVLPLVGYGGSSMICSLLTIGLLLALAKHHYRNSV